MQASRGVPLGGLRQVLNRQPRQIGNRAQVPGRNPAPLADGGMRDVAGARDTHDHPALIEKRGKNRFPLHAASMSDYPTICKREFAGGIGTSHLAGASIRPHDAGMVKLDIDHIARRLRAIRAETGKTVPELAETIGANKSAYYTWERGSAASKPNFPAEEAMATLCDLLPGLTLDYIYRGKLHTMPANLAIRLVAREAGLDPEDQTAARRAWADALAEQA